LCFEIGTQSDYCIDLLVTNWKNLNMRRRKTSHQPNFKAARAVVLGQDGVGKSGILLTLVIYTRRAGNTGVYHMERIAVVLSYQTDFSRAPFRFITIKSNKHLKSQVPENFCGFRNRQG